MVRWSSFAAGCGLTALVAVSAAGIGAASASAPVPSVAPTAQSTYSWGGNIDGYYTTQWNATKEDRAWVEALSKLDYNSMTLAEFRDKAAPWQDETAYHKAADAYKRLRFSIGENDPLGTFVRDTLASTMDEAACLHYKGSCDQQKPLYSDTAIFEVNADVFGDSYTVFSAQANYGIDYTAADALTVGERDRIFADYRKAVEDFLSQKGEKALKDTKVLGKALEAELIRLNKEHSTEKMALQAKLDGYEAHDWRE